MEWARDLCDVRAQSTLPCSHLQSDMPTSDMPIESPLISAPELIRLSRQDAPVFIFDCRFRLADERAGERAYGKGHIPGARYAHLNRDLSDLAAPPSEGRHPLPPPETFCAWLAAQGAFPDARFVVYDDAGGAIASRLWWMLRAQGAPDVRVLDGGLAAWRGAGGALEDEDSARARPERRPWSGCRPWPVASREAVLQAAAAGLLVDARDALRYAGIEEPIDPVAGHIPGAENLPFKDLLAPDGYLLPAQELSQSWLAVAERPADCVVYCGSGVTACHLILSAAAAGLGEPRLFPPSWSGWIAQNGDVAADS